MKYKEIEYKYHATGVSLKAFVDFCERVPHTYTEASGYDHFYSSKKDAEKSFCRHRIGPHFNQLTFKRKTNDKNNFVRTEHNIDLLPKVNRDQISAIVSEFGYAYNFSLFKTCFIYKYPTHTFVYYICYDSDMKETGRFLEVEMDEDTEYQSEQSAMDELNHLEGSLLELGITPQRRLRNSLYEMYRKDAV